MNSNFVIIGLPASGKTTFLAALWHLIESEELTPRLSLAGYDGNFKYLNEIAEAWRTFKKVPRTSQYGSEINITINLKNNETGMVGEAYFPDLAGEVFDNQVELRRCRPEFVQAISADSGILFFVSANLKGEGLSVKELNALFPEPYLAPQVETTNHYDKPNRDELSDEWSPKGIPAQVRTVQILSDLLRYPFDVRKRRLAMIVSAWDLVDASGITPETWLERSMPLLSQFLISNDKFYEAKVYGVSAQGVNLEDPIAVKHAAQSTAPSERIKLVTVGEESHDLTSPLVWLMSQR